MTRPSTAGRSLVPRTLRRRARRLRARSRLRAANVRGTGAALRRRSAAPGEGTIPPVEPACDVETTYGAPRTLLTVTVKRDNPHGVDLYGHWWVEAGEQSWGWWPRAVPVGLRQLARGTEGVLNGTGLVGRKGTWQRDPQHGRRAAHAFHPVLVEPISDTEVLARLQSYALTYGGAWRWAWTRRSSHDTCRTFQDGLLRAAGLTETPADLASRGSGCPFLYPARTVLWRVQDLLDAARRCRSSRATVGEAAASRVPQVLSSSERVDAHLLRVLRPGGVVVYSFCSRPARRRDRWRTGPTRAVVHALFAGHFLRDEQTPFHDCDVSRRSSFAAGAATVVLLGKCYSVAAARAGRTLPPVPRLV